MDTSLSGKRAWVSGATRGIGRAVAVALAGQGAGVVVAGRDETALEAVTASLPRGEGVRHGWRCADFTDPAAVARAADAELAEHGALDILVNNTGGPPGGPIVLATTDQFLACFTQHLVCNHALAQAMIPGMTAAGYGRIVNVVSTSVKQPIPGLGVSNTVRGAVASWAKTLAGEVAGSGITVNNVLPGATLTGRLRGLIAASAERTGATEDEAADRMRSRIPAGRFGEPEEIAAAVAFLASPAAGYITGTSLPVDGGRTEAL